MDLLRSWLLFLSGFEVLTLAKAMLGEPLHKLMPIFAATTDARLLPTVLLITTFLLLVRVHQAFAMSSKPAWALTAAIHVTEAIYFTHIASRDGTVAPFLPGAFAPLVHGMPTLIYGIILANAVVFTAKWATMPAGGAAAPAAGKGKKAH